MLLGLTALAMATAAADDGGNRPFVEAAELCYTFLVNRGASTELFAKAGFTAKGKNATEQLFGREDARTLIVVRQTDRFPIPECVSMTPAWESEVKALVPKLTPVLGAPINLGSTTTFQTTPTSILAFLKSTKIQGGHFAILEMNRIDKEKSE
ncbi:MAG: hypothetical protein ACJ8EY_04280 [Sphingomicrobium sp.]